MFNQSHWDADTKLDEDTKLQFKLLFESAGFKCDINKTIGDDRGIDIILNNHINVDIKTRRFTVERYNDILIEIYANHQTKRLGWGTDDSRLTHVYLYKFDNRILLFNAQLIHEIGVSQLKNVDKNGQPIRNHNRFRICDQGDYSTINYHHPLSKIIDQRLKIKDLI